MFRATLRFLLRAFLFLLLTLIVVWYSVQTFQTFRRPKRAAFTEALYQGVTYERMLLTEPRRVIVHVVEIDLTAEGVSLFVTPKSQRGIENHIRARRTTEFVDEFDLQLGINGSFFYPFAVGTPLTYYPKSGDIATTVGFTMSGGDIYSPDDDKFWALCVNENGAAQEVEVRLDGRCSAEAVHALSGNSVFVRDGAPHVDGNAYNNRPYARVAVATDASSQRVWFLLVDGKQRFYSEGLSLAELADVAVDLGAAWAINLDGGGSTSLAVADAAGGPAQLYNSPKHTGVVFRERPVANHIGVRALPLPEQ